MLRHHGPDQNGSFRVPHLNLHSTSHLAACAEPWECLTQSYNTDFKTGTQRGWSGDDCLHSLKPAAMKRSLKIKLKKLLLSDTHVICQCLKRKRYIIPPLRIVEELSTNYCIFLQKDPSLQVIFLSLPSWGWQIILDYHETCPNIPNVFLWIIIFIHFSLLSFYDCYQIPAKLLTLILFWN